MEHQQINTQKVSRGTFSKADNLYEKHRPKLDLYLNRLLWWNQRINLVSRDVPRETIVQHIRHSLLISALPSFKEATTIVDAGTGGGLPGIPLAITHPEKQLTLNDIVSKKCLAMKQIVRKLQLQNVTVSDGSVEEVSQAHPFLLISKHAFKLNDLVSMTVDLPWKTIILYKGLPFENELQGLQIPLAITAYDLSDESEFYTDKALIVINR